MVCVGAASGGVGVGVGECAGLWVGAWCWCVCAIGAGVLRVGGRVGEGCGCFGVCGARVGWWVGGCSWVSVHTAGRVVLRAGEYGQ